MDPQHLRASQRPSAAFTTPLTDLRQATDALREELDAMVGYRERAAACADPRLCEILNHHAREEAEHAAMLIEWLRRNESAFSEYIDAFVGSAGSVVAAEASTRTRATVDRRAAASSYS